MTLNASSHLIATLAPTGRLRAAINLGNPILAGTGADGAPKGVSIDLARRLAEQLGLPLDLLVFDTAGKSVDAVTREEADFGFFAVDPVRGAGIGFTFGAMPALIMGAVPASETGAANSLNTLMRSIGTSSASAVAAVPEPTTLAVVAGGALVFLRRRRA